MSKGITRSSIALSAAFTAVSLAGPALGCPVCDSETGQEVRDGIFDGQFIANLASILLPFAVLLGTVVLIHFGLPLPRSWPGRADRRAGGER